MFGYRKPLWSFKVLVVISLLLTCPIVLAETWRLDQAEDWKEVQPQGKDKYLLEVSRLKELLNKAQPLAVRQAWEKLKEDFPEIAGPDLDAFIRAEMLFAEGEFIKAVRSYDKFLLKFPESKLYQAALDREFTMAEAFLAGRKKSVLGILKFRGYAEGEKIMDKIADRAGNAPIGIRASIAVAKNYEKRGKFEEAYQKWSEISSRWPTGEIGRDALLAEARCKYYAYQGPKYDVSDLISAKSYYEDFSSKYPQYAQEIDIAEKIENINELLAEKQFNIAQYYQKTSDFKAAEMCYQMVVAQWPQSAAAKIANKKLNEIELQSEKEKNEEK
ncbi:outer membrane protein assembly factor BamD [Planctomycetota bacterium]